MNKIKQYLFLSLYIFLQCTWGILQTLAGLALLIRHRSCPHHFFIGAVHTCWNRPDGISLGLFIFTQKDCREMTVHEYGHTWQSLILGPFYLPVIGLPSLLWCRLPFFRQLRQEKALPYSAFFTERWADRLGSTLTAVGSHFK